MFLFLVSFIIFTITNTFFHDIKISILTFVLCLTLLSVFLILKHKSKFFKHAKYFLIFFGSFIFSASTIIIKDYRYSPELVNNFIKFTINNKSSGSFVTTPAYRTGRSFIKEDKIVYYIGTGKIIDTYSYGKYIFQNNLGKEYILNTYNNYQIGDKLRLVGYVKDINFNQNKNISGLWEPAYRQAGRSFDYDKWLIMKGYNGNIYEQNSIKISDDKNQMISENNRFRLQSHTNAGVGPKGQIGFISQIKRSLQSQIYSTYGEDRNAGLIMGMLIGDKSQIPKSDYQNFIDSGLVHLIAVSGGNIIMLTIFLSFILFFLPFYLRNFIILLSIILYSFICGMDSSVVRAVIFGGLGMMALFVGREMNFRRSVYIVFILMLLINPYFLLYDLGFLLSFGAVIGINILNKNNKKILDSSLNSEGQMRLKRIVSKIYNNYLRPSIGANLGIIPIIIFFMGKINLIGFITNLFVLPIVPFVMIYGFISILLYSLLPRNGFTYIQELLINYIYKVSEIGSNYGIYLLVNDYKIKYLILILFIIGLIIYMVKNKIIFSKKPNTQKYINISIKHKNKKSN